MKSAASARVLIADDHPLFREALRAVVARVAPDASFVEAASRRELLALTASGAFDLIFVDLVMPGGDHFAELEALRRRRPDTATIVISSRHDWATIRRAMACGISGYIPKSSSTATMETAIRCILAGDVYVPQDARGIDPGVERATTVCEPLTPRQSDVLEQLRRGRSNRQIASDLGIEEVTVKVHISAILRKLHVKNRLQAILASTERVDRDE
ncbi:MAG: response regulator transcription factor [Vulcanimicrobiaceae bacterium]